MSAKNQLPNSFEAEKAVLGHVLRQNESINRVLEFLRPKDFHDGRHYLIFKAMFDMLLDCKSCDIVTLTEFLKDNGALRRAGGIEYISTLSNGVHENVHIDDYCRILQEKMRLRELASLGADIVMQSNELDASSGEISDIVSKAICDISESKYRPAFISLDWLMPTALDSIKFAREHRGQVTGISMGFHELDAKTSGFQPGELTIVAAGHSMGKTSLALNLLHNVGILKKIPVGFFSLGQTVESICARLISSAARLDTHLLRTGHLSDIDWQHISQVSAELESEMICLDDTPENDTMSIRVKARRLKAERNIGLVVVDNVQSVQINIRQKTAQQKMCEVFRELKSLATYLDIPVVAFYRLNNRDFSSGSNKRPALGNLNHVDAIERYADVILFIHREAIYCEYCMQGDGLCPHNHRDAAEIIIGKQSGPLGSVNLQFSEGTGRFEEL